MLKNKLTFIALSTLSFTATSFLVINTPASASVRSTIPASLRGTWYGSTDAGVYKYTFTKTTLSEELGLPTNNYKFKKQKASIAGRITYRIGYQKNRLSINSQKDRKGFWRFKLSLNLHFKCNTN
ncbi:hypothetical protein KOM07_12540 [Lentilactobacillus sp. G22-6]|uniref:hypothetical protein n=1 Tax=Lentilactobacillus dabitei TaxID=2831523 RepID=UPI001C27E1E7|nr:hypothetical protein [Lentilactobacillus dabitei]MBU9790339.1 hypothetical protein [Lentilactobacillus dabitei]